MSYESIRFHHCVGRNSWRNSLPWYFLVPPQQKHALEVQQAGSDKLQRQWHQLRWFRCKYISSLIKWRCQTSQALNTVCIKWQNNAGWFRKTNFITMSNENFQLKEFSGDIYMYFFLTDSVPGKWWKMWSLWWFLLRSSSSGQRKYWQIWERNYSCEVPGW